MAKLIEIVKEWGFDSDGKPAEYAVQDGRGKVKFGDGHAVLNHYSGVWHRDWGICSCACVKLAEDCNTKILTYEEWKDYHSRKDETEQMKPQDLGCFEEVAKVIGEKAAEVELQKVIDSGIPIRDGLKLPQAFSWDFPPQGYTFWKDVADGVIPKEYCGTRKSIVEGAFGCIGVNRFITPDKLASITPTLEDFLEKAAELDSIMYHTSIDCDKLIVIERPNGSLAEVSIEDFFEAADKIIAVHKMFK